MLFKVVIGLAFVAGLTLALTRPDLGSVVRPAMGVLLLCCGLFLMSRHAVVQGAMTPGAQVFRNSLRMLGLGNMFFGLSLLLPIGWLSTVATMLGALVMLSGAWRMRKMARGADARSL
jgi:hypothetical protein